MLKECDGKFHFDYVLADSWYSSADNMIYCKTALNNHFIMDLKSNRKIALSKENKDNKEYVSIETLQPGQQTTEIWLKEF